MKKRIGKFITFEGIEGCGKSTQIKHLESFFKKHKQPCMVVREPGGTRISEKIRTILLDKNNNMMVERSELLLYCAARAQITQEVIMPALAQGVHVLCDRFYDSTMAYQGFGLGMDKKTVQELCYFAAHNVHPDCTILIDLPVTTGLKRAGGTDRIEERSLAYHRKVRKGFCSLVQQHKKRFLMINGRQDIESIRCIIEEHIRHVIGM